MKRIFNLKNLAFLSIMAMPLYLLKISFWGIPTNIFELLACVTVIVFLYCAQSLEIELGGHKRYFMPIVMILAGLLLSTLYNENYRIGFGVIKSWFIVPIIFSWACSQIFIDKKNVLKAVYVSSFFTACLSLIYFLSGDVTFDGRLQAFYNSPNFLAMHLAPAVIIGFFLFKDSSKLYAGSLLIIIGSFYLTKSYAAWAAVFVPIAIFMFAQKKVFDWKKAAGLIFLLGALFLMQKDTDKFSSLVEMKERSSAASRVMIWSSALKIGLDNPVIGIGPGNFQSKYLEYQKYFPPYLEWAAPQPHNLFFAFWLQSGIVGLGGFLWLVFVWARSLAKAGRMQKENYVYAAIMLCIVIHGLVDTTYFKNDLAVVFWLVIFSIKKHSSHKEECSI